MLVRPQIFRHLATLGPHLAERRMGINHHARQREAVPPGGAPLCRCKHVDSQSKQFQPVVIGRAGCRLLRSHGFTRTFPVASVAAEAGVSVCVRSIHTQEIGVDGWKNPYRGVARL